MAFRDRFLNHEQERGPAAYRRSKHQEREVAKRTRKGALVPASGSGALKGDVRLTGVARIECKTTQKQSFALTRDMVRAIEAAGLSHGEVPALVIEFVDAQGRPDMEVLVMPRYAFELLLDR